MASLPAGEQPGAYLRAWCRLEARLKARGEGLAGLERLRQPEPGGATDALEPLGSEALWDVTVLAGYGAAVALALAQGPAGGGGRGRSSQSSAVRG